MNAPPKKITAAIMSNPAGISRVFIGPGGGSYPGGDALEELVNAGLTRNDTSGIRQAQLAEALPTVENGMWKLLPGGQMETTFRLRPNLVWHDGTPITTADLVFDRQLEQDQDLPIFVATEWELVEDMRVVDDRTVTLLWKQPFIRADAMFEIVRPKHVLEKPYTEDKGSLLSHPYWTDQHIGAGPFKLRQWQLGSFAVITAFDQYALGRPKIDEITVKFIPDPGTLAANVLAGEVELTMGRNISLQQAMQVKDHWQGGNIDVGFSNWIALYPQAVNPGQPLLANVQFRRAIANAIDRQQIVDTLLYGMSPIAHTFVSPTEPVFSQIEPDVVKYDFDQRRAAQAIEALGYTRGSGGPFSDAAGKPLGLEVRTSGGDDTHEAGVFAVVDSLKRVGIAAEPYFIPQNAREDRAANVSYPGLRLWRLPNDLWTIDRFHSRQAGTPENNFRQNSNRARYMNPELDGFIYRYMSTITAPDRVPLLGQVVHHQSDQLSVIGLWYNTEPIVVGHRLRNVQSQKTGDATITYGAHTWDVAIS